MNVSFQPSIPTIDHRIEHRRTARRFRWVSALAVASFVTVGVMAAASGPDRPSDPTDNTMLRSQTLVNQAIADAIAEHRAASGMLRSQILVNQAIADAIAEHRRQRPEP